MPIELKITADTLDRFKEDLYNFVKLLNADNPVMDLDKSPPPDETAPTPVEPMQQGRRGPGRPSKKANGAAPSDAAAEPGTGQQPDAPAPAAPEPADELKGIVQRLTTLCTSDPQALSRVTAWRNERGLKWIRDLTVEHLPDARALAAELGIV